MTGSCRGGFVPPWSFMGFYLASSFVFFSLYTCTTLHALVRAHPFDVLLYAGSYTHAS